MKKYIILFSILPILLYSQDKKCFKSYKKEIDSLLKIEKVDLAKKTFNNMIMSCESNSKRVQKIQNFILNKSNYNVIDGKENDLIASDKQDVYRKKKGVLVNSSPPKIETPPPVITKRYVSNETLAKSEELINAKIYDDINYLMIDNYFLVEKNKKYGICDSKFNIILPEVYDEIIDKYNYLVIKKDNKQSIFDFKTKKITLPFYREIRAEKYLNRNSLKNFVLVYKSHNHDNGLFYTDGSIFIDFPPEGKEQNIYIEEEEEKIFILKNYDKSIICDYDGKTIASGYGMGYYSDIKEVVIKNNQQEWAVIDLNGKFIIPFSDSEITKWGDYFLLERKGKKGIADKSGKTIIPIIYDQIEYPSYDTFVFRKDNKYGLINKFNRFVIEPKYEEIDGFLGERLYYEFLRFKQNNKYGLMDVKGNIIIPPKYDYIGAAKEKFLLFAVYLDKKVGIANVYGKEIIPPIYNKLNHYTSDDVLEFEKDGKIITINNPEIPPKIQKLIDEN